MNNKKFLYTMTILVIACFTAIICSNTINSFKAYASNEVNEIPSNVHYFEGYGEWDENENSNTYAEAIHNATRLPVYVDDASSITILVAGQSCNSRVWSNNGGVLAYDNSSLIEELRLTANNSNVYYARMSINDI